MLPSALQQKRLPCRDAGSVIAGWTLLAISVACGGILEEIPEGQPIAETGQDIDADTRPVPGPSSVESTERVAKPPIVVKLDEERSEPEVTGPDWRCQQCGEIVPGNFDVCWHCLTTKAGEPEPNAAQLLTDTCEIDQQSELADPLPASDCLATADAAATTSAPCPRCGSTGVLRGVLVADQGEGSSGKLNVVIVGNPQALFFKDRLYGEIRANVCGQCGHVELRVVNPGELYQHYLKSLSQRQPSDAKAYSAFPCRKCGMLVVRGLSTCPHCGACQLDW